MKLGMILYTADPETVWNAFRFGTYALREGDAVRIFLMGKGVECGSGDSGIFTVQEMMQSFADNGGEILACGSCLAIRHADGSALCPASTLKDMYDVVANADKVLTF